MFFETYKSRMTREKKVRISLKVIGGAIGYSESAFSRLLKNKNPITKNFVEKVLYAYETNKLHFTINEVQIFQALTTKILNNPGMAVKVDPRGKLEPAELSSPQKSEPISPIKQRILALLDKLDDEELIRVETNLKEHVREYLEELNERNNKNNNFEKYDIQGE